MQPLISPRSRLRSFDPVTRKPLTSQVRPPRASRPCSACAAQGCAGGLTAPPRTVCAMAQELRPNFSIKQASEAFLEANPWAYNEL